MADTDLLDYAGLKHYDSKIKSCMWNWQKTKKAAAVAFKPVPESDLEPVVDFIFTEIPPAEGDKGPGNPSTISGVDSANVTRCGKNLLATPYANGPSYTFRGFTATENNDGSITWSGTTDNNGSCHFRLNALYSFRLCSGVAYTALLTGTVNQNIVFQAFDSSGRIVFSVYAGGTPVNFSVDEDKYITLRVSVSKEAGSLDNVIVYPQLELGTTATVFEPYEGTNYTVQLGGTYYGGSLNVATGVMTVTHTSVVLDGTETWYGGAHDSDQEYYGFACSVPSGPANLTQVCTHFDYANSLYTDFQHFVVVGSGVHFYVTQETTTEFKTWLADQYTAGTPVTVCYTLTTPYTIQLTPTQIRSLPALDKYAPRINTIYSDQQAVQVGHQRFYDENRLAAIEARLDALEGN